MSSDLNLVLVTGRVSQAPELKYTTGGKAVCTFSLDIKREYRDREGQDHTKHCFVDVTCWGDAAEKAATFCLLDHRFEICAELSYESWESQGKKRSKVKLNVPPLTGFIKDMQGNEIREMSEQAEQTETTAEYRQRRKIEKSVEGYDGVADEAADDNIPF